MSIGQFGNSMASLVYGSHLNANSDDFSANNWDGGDVNISYDKPSAIIGSGGALFNGVDSRILLNTNLENWICKGSYTVATLISLPAAAPSTQPIWARGVVARYDIDDKVYYYHGTGLIVNANDVTFYRNIGMTTQTSFTLPYAFESSKRYLVGVTYSKLTGYCQIFVYPLYAGKARAFGTSDMGKPNVWIWATYDQGLNIGANCRNTGNQYSTCTFNEFLIFSSVKPLSWFVDYAAYLRGFK